MTSGGNIREKELGIKDFLSYDKDKRKVRFSSEESGEDTIPVQNHFVAIPEIDAEICGEEKISDKIDCFVDFVLNNVAFLQSNLETESQALFVQKYFEILTQLLRAATRVFDAREYRQLKALIEELNVFGCLRKNNGTEYLVSDYHPVRMMYELADTEFNQELKTAFGNGDITEKERQILEEINHVKKEINTQYKICTQNEVYESCLEQDQKVIAKRFSEKGRLTKIDSVRLIEKIEHRKKQDPSKEVRIACFGELEKLEKKGYLNGAEIVTFELKKDLGEYFFEAKEEQEGASTYNLLSSMDIERLIRKYSIVLFLDYSYFYRQRQEPNELNLDRICEEAEWYLRRASRYQKIKDKAVCYQYIYDYVNMWLDSDGKDRTSEYEFDENLFSAIEDTLSLAADDANVADIYLYIGYGLKISGRRLERENVCNNEYYNGNKINVYKYAYRENINEELARFDGEVRSERKVYIDLWKLVKSISDSYMWEFVRNLHREWNETEKIDWLRGSYLILDYAELNYADERPKIKAGISLKKDIPKEEKKTIIEFAETVTKYGLGDGNILCAKRFFRRLLSTSVVSRAGSVDDLLFAHLLNRYQTKKYDISEVAYVESTGKPSKGHIEGFRVRRTIFAVIQHADEICLRTGEDVEDYFVTDFRRKYCKDVSEQNLKNIMKQLADSCDSLKYDEGQLCVYSKMMR